MSQSVVNSREVQKRIAEAMRSYREAFEAVERELARIGPVRKLPPFVFAIDRLTAAQLHLLPPELAEAEALRRRERVALQCLVELLALEQLPGVDWSPPVPLQDPAKASEELLARAEQSGNDDASNLGDMDRFVSIMDYARRHGVIYINGTFETVKKRRPQAPEGEENS